MKTPTAKTSTALTNKKVAKEIRGIKPKKTDYAVRNLKFIKFIKIL